MEDRKIKFNTSFSEAMNKPAEDVDIPEQTRFSESLFKKINNATKSFDEKITRKFVGKYAEGYEQWKNKDKISEAYKQGKYFDKAHNLDVISNLVFKLAGIVGMQEEAVQLLAPTIRKLIETTNNPLLKQFLSVTSTGLLRAEEARRVTLKNKLIKKFETAIDIIKITGSEAFKYMKTIGTVISNEVKQMASNFVTSTDDFFANILTNAGFLGPFVKMLWPYIEKAIGLIKDSILTVGKWLMKGMFSPVKYLFTRLMSKIFSPTKSGAAAVKTSAALIKGVDSVKKGVDLLRTAFGENNKLISKIYGAVSKLGKISEGHTLGKAGEGSPFAKFSEFKQGFFSKKPYKPEPVKESATTFRPSTVAGAATGTISGGIFTDIKKQQEKNRQEARKHREKQKSESQKERTTLISKVKSVFSIFKKPKSIIEEKVTKKQKIVTGATTGAIASAKAINIPSKSTINKITVILDKRSEKSLAKTIVNNTKKLFTKLKESSVIKSISNKAIVKKSETKAEKQEIKILSKQKVLLKKISDALGSQKERFAERIREQRKEKREEIRDKKMISLLQKLLKEHKYSKTVIDKSKSLFKGGIFGSLLAGLGGLLSNVTGLIGSGFGLLKTALLAIGGLGFMAMLKKGVSGIFSLVKNVGKAALTIGSLAKKFFTLPLFTKIFDGLKTFVKNPIENIKKLVTGLKDSKIFASLSSKVENLYKYIKSNEFIQGIVSKIKGVVSSIKDFLTGNAFLNNIKTSIRNFFKENKVIKNISTAASIVVDKIKPIGEAIIKGVVGILKVIPGGTKVLGALGIATLLKDKIKAKTPVKKVTDTVKNVTDKFGKVKEKSILQKIKTGIKESKVLKVVSKPLKFLGKVAEPLMLTADITSNIVNRDKEGKKIFGDNYNPASTSQSVSMYLGTLADHFSLGFIDKEEATKKYYSYIQSFKYKFGLMNEYEKQEYERQKEALEFMKTHLVPKGIKSLRVIHNKKYGETAVGFLEKGHNRLSLFYSDKVKRWAVLGRFVPNEYIYKVKEAFTKTGKVPKKLAETIKQKFLPVSQVLKAIKSEEKILNKSKYKVLGYAPENGFLVYSIESKNKKNAAVVYDVKNKIWRVAGYRLTDKQMEKFVETYKETGDLKTALSSVVQPEIKHVSEPQNKNVVKAVPPKPVKPIKQQVSTTSYKPKHTVIPNNKTVNDFVNKEQHITTFTQPNVEVPVIPVNNNVNRYNKELKNVRITSQPKLTYAKPLKITGNENKIQLLYKKYYNEAARLVPNIHEFAKRIKRYEGVKLHKYKDSKGIWTIGTGHNIDTAHGGIPLRKIIGVDKDTITMEENETILYYDIARTAKALYSKYPWVKKQPLEVQHILLDMAFNMGVGKLGEFKKMLRAIKQGDYRKAAIEMQDSAWYFQTGRRSRELVAQMMDFDNKYRQYLQEHPITPTIVAESGVPQSVSTVVASNNTNYNNEQPTKKSSPIKKLLASTALATSLVAGTPSPTNIQPAQNTTTKTEIYHTTAPSTTATTLTAALHSTKPTPVENTVVSNESKQNIITTTTTLKNIPKVIVDLNINLNVNGNNVTVTSVTPITRGNQAFVQNKTINIPKTTVASYNIPNISRFQQPVTSNITTPVVNPVAQNIVLTQSPVTNKVLSSVFKKYEGKFEDQRLNTLVKQIAEKQLYVTRDKFESLLVKNNINISSLKFKDKSTLAKLINTLTETEYKVASANTKILDQNINVPTMVASNVVGTTNITPYQVEKAVVAQNTQPVYTPTQQTTITTNITKPTITNSNLVSNVSEQISNNQNIIAENNTKPTGLTMQYTELAEQLITNRNATYRQTKEVHTKTETTKEAQVNMPVIINNQQVINNMSNTHVSTNSTHVAQNTITTGGNSRVDFS